ncbi:MAG TPA: aconitate hydratase AcnA [Bryobacteraceae bacterium]|nr:aconitate hydratase AcnA [Bryobacteraceae bacterium]
MPSGNSFNSKSVLKVSGRELDYFSLPALEKTGAGSIARLPYSIRVLLENLLRHEDGRTVRAEDIEFMAKWQGGTREISFMPSRVLLQDFTGVPCVVDLAAMRDALQKTGGDPRLANPLIPCDLVIDHSFQVDYFGTKEAFGLNAALEFQRNGERYAFLRWGQQAFRNLRVVPPDTGIVHQVNLEYLASVAVTKEERGRTSVYPDSLVGTDSHTTMINGLGVLGWGVGGIEAEACMLGQPVSMLLPEVLGFRLRGSLREGTTATDLVLTVTEILRKKKVVGKFVEYFGPGVSALSVADRATLANMSPEYGATMGFFPVDAETIRYLRMTHRPAELVALVEAYTKEQGLFRTDSAPEPVFTEVVDLDLATVVPSMAGPRRPQDRINLPDVKANFANYLGGDGKKGSVKIDGFKGELRDGAVVIASITSCTNTSNPSVMIGAGLLAKKAAERGLRPKPWVKTSLAPGSKVVTEYLNASGLLPYLEALGFHVVGYGCATCIGNSGPLPEPVAAAIQKEKLVTAAVLSGNRNFEGRINALVRANYLASPPLVVAYALAGSMSVDLQNEPISEDPNGVPVYLREIWPTQQEVNDAVASFVRSEMFQREYSEVFKGDANWNSLDVATGDLFQWQDDSTYIKRPPYFDAPVDPGTFVADFKDMRVLALLGDSITTDHISPAGSIPVDSPAGQYLISLGVHPKDFNSYGSRRGNHEVMVRGTLANIRLRNRLAPGTEGGFTTHFPDREMVWIYDAAMRYQQEGVPLLIIAGKEYGSGSSRDWAAKGVNLLGVRVVIAESYERIHRSNLVGMGVLPLEFLAGEGPDGLGLTGKEVFHIEGVREAMAGSKRVRVRAVPASAPEIVFEAVVRVDTPQEAEYYRSGGILPYVLRQIAKQSAAV